MKFISTWTVPQGTFNAAVARFLETGGAPLEGVKMLGRWHGMNGQGFAISESSDPKAMYRWVAQWADLLPLTVTPCLEDADAGEVWRPYPSVDFQSDHSRRRVRRRLHAEAGSECLFIGKTGGNSSRAK